MGFPSLFLYIDPGSGAIILQVLLAMLLTFGAIFWRLLLAPFRIFQRKSEPVAEADGAVAGSKSLAVESADSGE